MKRFLNVAKIILPFAVLISLSGCFQYPEGPFFTMQTRGERLNGTWKLISATDPAGNDVLNDPAYQDSAFVNITFTAIADRSGTDNWVSFQNGILRSTGTFSFAEHGDDIIVIYAYLNYADVNGTQLFYTIRKLTDKYFYYIDDMGNTIHFQKF